MNEIVATASTVLLSVLPWALGGVRPTREDLTWAILLSFATGFLSICTTVMSVFDMSRVGTVERRQSMPDGTRDRPPRRTRA